MATKRIVLCGDLHCGHLIGLTPPSYQITARSNNGKIAEIQRQCWDWFRREVRDIGKVHLVIANGDLIEGEGEKSGGTECITTDTIEQATMATQCLQAFDAANYHLTYGTPYHVGKSDTERIVAHSFGCKIGAHEWPQVNGVVIDAKHKVGTSSVYSSQTKAVQDQDVWNALWAEQGLQPRGDIIIRSHCHYHTAVMRVYRDRQRWMMTLPALQAMGSKFGSRQCSSLVHFGFVTVDVKDNGEYSWQSHIATIAAQRASVTRY